MYENIENVKKLALFAMFSVDELLDRLVLKGGNALDLVYQLNARSSQDLDFSIDNEIGDEELERITTKIARSLEDVFGAEGFVAFDINLKKVPPRITPDIQPFWGGYLIDFKIIEREKFKALREKDGLRVNALVVGLDQRKTFQIQISRYEFCEPKLKRELDGFTIFVYTPQMLAFEKVRAICQQMPEYLEVVKGPAAPRARDFVDIQVLTEKFKINFSSQDSLSLVKSIFNAKKVPVQLVGKIPDFREFHRQDFAAVEATVRASFKLEKFDFYFDYVVGQCKQLEPLWIEKAPGS